MACPPCDQRLEELLACCVVVDNASSCAKAALSEGGSFPRTVQPLWVLSDCLIGFVGD